MNIEEALSGRAGIAGIDWLLQGNESQVALRNALACLLPDQTLLGNLRLYRAKAKPGRHLTAYYEVVVADSHNGVGQVRHVEVVWLPPGAPDPRGAPADLERMQQEIRDLGIMWPFTGLLAADPDWGLWLQVSPLDAVYPQLAYLSAPQHINAMLASIPDLGVLGEYTISTVRYRPGQRHVLRYQPADSAENTLYAKIYTGDKGSRIFSVVRKVVKQLQASAAPINAVQPAAYLPELQVALYRAVPGIPLSHLLNHAEISAYLRLAGTSLRAIHQIPTDLVELKPYSLEQELKSLASASEQYQMLLPQAAARIQALIERARMLHAKLPQATPGFAYGDFKTDHLWITPAGMTLIDFDTCYLFDQAIDIGKFLADLRWWYAQSALTGVEIAQTSFLEGYDPKPDLLARARLYEALILAKMTARRVPLFAPDWPDRTMHLIMLADQLLPQ